MVLFLIFAPILVLYFSHEDSNITAYKIVIGNVWKVQDRAKRRNGNKGLLGHICLEEKEKAGCFAIFVLQIYDFKSTLALPHGAVGLSAVFDCDISWSYSINFR